MIDCAHTFMVERANVTKPLAVIDMGTFKTRTSPFARTIAAAN